MSYDKILKETEGAMDKALNHLKTEFKGVRTGRASAGLVENVQVESYGSRQPLKNVASITADQTTITIKPYDASQLKEISKAIKEANIGLNPQDDGKVVRINMPPMTEENRKKIAGQLKDMAEKVKITLRNARQDGNKHADAAAKDKNSGLTEDTHRKLKDEIQKLTDRYNKKVDEAVTEKTAEVMKV